MTPDLLQNNQAGREAFRELAMHIVNWLLRYYQDMDSYPVRSQVKPGEMLAKFPQHPPDYPISIPAVMESLDENILPGITHWQHPRFFAFFPGNAGFPSIGGEMLAAGIAAQCMMWETSPIAAELEQRCLEWCAQLLGLPQHWKGVIQDTASTATLTSLLTAREWKSGFRISKRGFDGTRYRIYTSEEAHSSIEKAVRLAGFGTENLVKIPTDQNLSMNSELLEKNILADLKSGFVPTAVISTLGTTSTGAVDPIDIISGICTNYGLWHHLDAAYAGSALMLADYENLREGLEGVDSFVFNPHKWMFMQFDCSCYYVRDAELLLRTMTISPTYLISDEEEQHRDYKDWGIPLGRRFRALKMWMTFCLIGTEAIKEQLQRHLELSLIVEDWISSHEKLKPGYTRSFNINTFCFKENFDPDGTLIKKLGEVINQSGKLYLTHTKVRNQSLLRFVTGQTYTEESHVVESLAYIDFCINKIV